MVLSYPLQPHIILEETPFFANARDLTDAQWKILAVVYWQRSSERFSSPGNLFRYKQFYDLGRDRFCITLS